ncbi:MAG TPA: SIMPL domain-containing protein [Aliidongia sp.]|nr:SIMPL domain-containing protein [Aliidongia sp.]
MIRYSMGQGLLALLLAGPALAADPPKPPPPPPVAAEQPATMLHLTETAERRLPRDELHAELAVELSDEDAGKLQAAINQGMATALAKAKAVKGITIETLGYSAQPEKTDQASVWHGSQSLQLSSRDFAAIQQLAGALQEQGLVMRRLDAELSRDAARAVRDELTDEAIRHLKLRAERIAMTLDARIVAYRELRVVGGGIPIAVVNLGMLRSAAPPAVEAGEATVSMSVDAAVELLPRSH